MAVKTSSVTEYPPKVLEVRDEGIPQGKVGVLDFVGAGVTATVAGNIGTVNIPGGGAGSVSFTAATITVPFGQQSQITTVIDAAILGVSKIMVIWGMFTQTDENTADMDNVSFNATPNAFGGSMSVLVSSIDSFVGGTYKIMYLIG